jgi:hypothetical protein
MKLEQCPHWILSLGNKVIADGKNCLVTLLKKNVKDVVPFIDGIINRM